jgi:carboxyl-terminal processing protease
MSSALRVLRPFAPLLWTLLLVPGGAAVALPGEQESIEPLAPLEEHPRTSRNVVEQLARHHYVRRDLNDDLSSDVLDRYLEMLDPQRSYFLADQVQDWEKYRYTLDDALRAGDLDPAYTIFNAYQARMVDRLEYSIELLEAGIDQFDFSVDESLETDRTEAEWPADEAALDDLWRKRIKASVLSMRLNDMEEAEIQEVMLKRHRNRLDRARQNKSEDAFQLYMNAVAGAYDPHTQYFSPRTSENFNISMSLSLEGIGAVLSSEDGYTTVARLVPAGPAQKSDQIEPSDRIISVGQGEEGEWVDVVGWRLDDVVDLIRGPAGSTVRLEILASGEEAAGAGERIALVREAVKLEEQSAQSRVMELERNGSVHRIGVIDIPTFYIDFKALQEGDPNYKSTTRDVRKLIDELKEEEVDGIVVDLRNNGGGSLQEANALTGLFIKAGPTVQVRSASGRVDLFNDEDGEVAWDGPLAVMVNRLSASASEIFAGAIQDYQRGLIIGGQTFGKGTVQTLIPLNRGQLKMTQAKFYRVSGQSTQHQGVIPDIEYPEIYDHEEIGESTMEDALPWDVIRPTRFRRAPSMAPLLSMLENRHSSRVSEDPEFGYLRDLLDHNRARSDRDRISLNEQTRRDEDAKEDAWRLELENRRRVAQGKKPVDSLEALEEAEEEDTHAAAAGRVPLAEADDEAAEGDADAEADTDSAAEAGTDPDASEGAKVAAGADGADDGAAENTASQTAEAGQDEAGEKKEAAEGEADAVAEADTVVEDPDALLEESGQILLDYITLSRSVAELDAGRSGSDAARD